MSNRRRNKPAAKQLEPARKPATDSFTNALARLGFGGGNNIMEGTSYPLTRISRDFNLLTSLYRNSWLAKKIVNCIAEDMTKNWFSVTSDLTPEQTDRINKVERKTKIKDKVLESLYWGRLYGGAACVIIIDGHEDILDEPLELDDVGPNAFKGLMVVDRWSGIFPGTELITDASDPDFGLPEFYEVRDNASGKVLVKVHHSRIIRFVGRKLPYWEEQAEIHWGASELEHVFDELAKRDNTSWNIAALVFQANLLINKVDGMDQMLAMCDAESQRQFYNIKTAQNQMRNNNGMMIIGATEDVQAIQYTFSGLNDIYESFMLDVAGASEIPVTRLFGRSPAGMNATGESDMQNYYDMIAQEQNSVLLSKIEKLYPIIFMSEFGAIPNDLGFKFNPVKTPSDSEIAELVAKKVSAIGDMYDRNLITQRCAVTELHELSFTTNKSKPINPDTRTHIIRRI